MHAETHSLLFVLLRGRRRSWRPGHFRFAFSLDLATTIFNRAARLRTAAVLRFICVAIAATLIHGSASLRRCLLC